MIGILRYLIRIFFGIIEFFLGIRILLKLFGANEAAPFVTWAYDVTAPLVQPFAGVFPPVNLGPRFMIEMSAILALIIYSFIAWAIDQGLNVAQYKTHIHNTARAHHDDEHTGTGI